MSTVAPQTDPPGEKVQTEFVSGLGGTRAQSIQRLQIGLSGLAAMVLLVGLADIILDRASLTDANAVPEAAATVEPADDDQQNDPLADAGVVPDLPEEPAEQPQQRDAILPETGTPADTGQNRLD